LLPAFEFVAGLLYFFLVRPEIKEQIGLRHDGSLRREAVASQGAVGRGMIFWYADGRHIGWARETFHLIIRHREQRP
jgi:hypothetical protein